MLCDFVKLIFDESEIEHKKKKWIRLEKLIANRVAEMNRIAEFGSEFYNRETHTKSLHAVHSINPINVFHFDNNLQCGTVRFEICFATKLQRELHTSQLRGFYSTHIFCCHTYTSHTGEHTNNVRLLCVIKQTAIVRIKNKMYKIRCRFLLSSLSSSFRLFSNASTNNSNNMYTFHY